MILDKLVPLSESYRQPLPLNFLKEKGTWSFPFKISLPKNLPSSFEEASNHDSWFIPSQCAMAVKLPVQISPSTFIRYKLICSVQPERPSLHSSPSQPCAEEEADLLAVSVPFRLMERVIESQILPSPITQSVVKTFLLSSGKIKMTCTLDQHLNSLKIPIPLIVSVRNESSRNVQFLTVTLRQEIHYSIESTKNFVTKTSNIFYSTVPESFVAKGTRMPDKMFWITIPPTVKVATLLASNAIKVSYQLVVGLHSDAATDIDVTLPLYLIPAMDLSNSAKTAFVETPLESALEDARHDTIDKISRANTPNDAGSNGYFSIDEMQDDILQMAEPLQ